MTPRLALVALLSMPCFVRGETVIPVQWDIKLADRVTGDFAPGDGDTVVFDGGMKTTVTRGGSPVGVFFNARFSADLPKAELRPWFEPAPEKPCFTEVSKGKSDFELLDAAGKSRYRGTYEGAAYHATDKGCRRFVYLERGGALIVVDLRTFESEKIGHYDKGGLDTDLDGRLVNYTEGKDTDRTYDVAFGVKCTGYYYDRECTQPDALQNLGLDRWYRPRHIPARFIKESAKTAFRLVDASGKTVYKDGVYERNGSYGAQYSPDGRWFVYDNESRDVYAVDTKDWSRKRLIRCKSDTPCSPNFSTGGKYLDLIPEAYELPDFKPVKLPLWAWRTSPDDRWTVQTEEGIGKAYNERDIVLYDLVAGTKTAVLMEKQSYDAYTLFSPGGRLVYVHGNGATNDRGVFEVPSGRRVATLPNETYGDWSFSPDERFMIDMVISNRRSPFVDLRYGVTVWLETPEWPYNWTFSGSGRWLASHNGYAWRIRRGMVQRAVIAELVARKASVEKTLADGRAAALKAVDDAAAAKTKAVRTPKGEFESNAEFAARMKAADEQEAVAKAERSAEYERIKAVWDAKERDEGVRAREDLEAALDEEITEPAKVVVGAYDADAQEFSATLAAATTAEVKLSVPRAMAQAAKARTMEGEAVFRHKLEGGKVVREDLRLSVKDPVLGEVYSWSSGAGTAKRARTAPAAPAKLEVKAEFADADGDGRLAAGETAKLTVTVTNGGAGAAYGATVALTPAGDGLQYASRHFAGEVAPGTSKTVVVPLKALAGAPDGRREIVVTASDANGFASDPLKVVFETRARRGARLTVAGLKIADAGGDGVVTPGELAEVTLTVRNDGEGTASAAQVSLKASGADEFVQGVSRRALGALAPGQSAQARFTVFSNTALEGDKLAFVAALADGADAWEAPVEVPLRRALGAARELVVKGRDLPAAGAAPEAAETPTVRGEARPDAFAVILGAEDYPKAARVTNARRDAAAFRAFATGVLGVPDDAAHLFYLDDGVTLAELRKAFSPNGWLARRVGPKSDVFVFYAGHGAPSLDGKGAYLVPQDGDPNYAVETGFPIDDMLKALDGSKARSATVWVDACFSGADRESRPLLADARPLMVKAEPVVPPGKVALFSAATGAQVSSVYPAKRHGLFTWFSLRGLDGEADADKDGVLTAGELADFVGERVSRTAGSLDREQQPGYRGDRARVIARYRK